MLMLHTAEEFHFSLWGRHLGSFDSFLPGVSITPAAADRF